uniref:Uncharacterized protein n=1 Tax=Glossina austeni TaxID=7395 RepID=A0A1A9VIV0_GLOAU
MPPCLEHSSITSSRISESQLGLVSAMPLKRFVLLHVIKRTSRTFPTLEKNSSKSRARTRCDNCIQNTVRASRSSGLSSESGDLSGPRPLGDLLEVFEQIGRFNRNSINHHQEIAKEIEGMDLEKFTELSPITNLFKRRNFINSGFIMKRFFLLGKYIVKNGTEITPTRINFSNTKQ